MSRPWHAALLACSRVVSRGLAVAACAGLVLLPPAANAQFGYGGAATQPFTGIPGQVTNAPTTSSAVSGPPGWRLTPYVNVQETLTNNVNLQPKDQAQADLVTQITPGLRIQGNGARVSLNGFVAATGLFYINTGAQNNRVIPQVGLLGRWEAIEKFFFVEASANVQQTFYTPFGPQPSGLANATNNLYTTSSYRVSPYIQGVMAGNISYYLRNDNIWTSLGGAPVSVSDSYTNVLSAQLSSPVDPFGWQVQGYRSNVTFTDQSQAFLTELARLRLLYAINPQLQVSLDGGYEHNDYPATQYSGAIYGAGFRWTPTPRTNVVGNWEQRFFGSSYYLLAEHRTPLSVWSLNASRGISSFPQALATLPAGNVDLLLNASLQSRIPDPVARQAAVDQIIQQRGLPTTLTGPLTLYNQQILLLEQVRATFGILGARNSLFFNAFWVKTQPITASGTVIPSIGANVLTNNNEQYGVSAVFSHNLTAITSLNLSATGLRTDSLPPQTLETKQYILRAVVNTQLSAKTTGFVGLRYTWFDSNAFNDYTEAAAFAGLNHTF
ncbi:MAG: TIGR03016 family PEP-CTERM system-associated outer membrane protein [Burkholderiales bacterium]|nr:TIGR03016 family PEP-CTERM system-associated outer membrane protein [Burkholderiales bacterium]